MQSTKPPGPLACLSIRGVSDRSTSRPGSRGAMFSRSGERKSLHAQTRNGSAMMQFGMCKRLWALDSPTFTVQAHTLLYGLEGQLTIPMPAYLIEHPKGVVLFDTGLVPAAMDDPFAVYCDLASLTGIQPSPQFPLA